jgi:hypothetical protein
MHEGCYRLGPPAASLEHDRVTASEVALDLVEEVDS